MAQCLGTKRLPDVACIKMTIRTIDAAMELQRVSILAASLGDEDITGPQDRRFRICQVCVEWSNVIAKSMTVNETMEPAPLARLVQTHHWEREKDDDDVGDGI